MEMDDDWDLDSFLPTYIYDAMKEKKRFDTMRVSISPPALFIRIRVW